MKITENRLNEQVVLRGNSHTSFIGEVDSKKVFNVGSIGNSLDCDNRISYGILDFTNNELKLVNRRVSYLVSEIVDVVIRSEFPLLSEYKRIILIAPM